jgi:AcrR family transcriptional regulator
MATRRVRRSAVAARSLSRESILRAAAKIVERDGAEALSMRRLAGEMGTTAMAFYNHFADREALVEALVDALYAELSIPADDQPWDARLRQMFMAFLELARRRPMTWRLAMTRPSKPRAGQLLTQATLKALADAGLSDEEARSAYESAGMLVRGMLLWSAERPADTHATPGHQGRKAEGHADSALSTSVEIFIAGLRSIVEAKPKRTRSR